MMITVQALCFNPYQENTYVLSDQKGNGVIIDPGMSNGNEQNQLVNYINKNNIKPIAQINTHCHIDHILGNKFVFDQWGITPQFHKDELPLIEWAITRASELGFIYEIAPVPEKFLPESGTLKFGDIQLDLYFVPGHSPGHLCFHNPNDNFLIGGDVLFYQSIGRTDLPGGNHTQLIEGIQQKLFTQLTDECLIFPGHGPKTSIGFEKIHNPFCKIKS